MRKVLLSVMTVGFLLAFNACKKGDQGPIGPAGPTGAAGAAGPVGPAGANGADGSKILTGAGAPAATLGANGDFYFDSTAKSLYGPKANGAWPATGVVLSGPAGAAGATGATGATGTTGATGANGAAGAAGTKFLAGAGAPTAAIGAVGDFYFDTETSVFYGPKGTGATPWAASAGSNVMPLGRAYAAKTFYLTRGFESVTETAKAYGEVANVTYGKFDIITTYTINSDDAVRIANYPGWSDNREMAFEDVAGSGVFNKVPTAGNQLDPTSGAFDVDFSVGRRFIYTNNTANPTTTFALTQVDINRLTENNGAAFGYLTYAKVTTSASNPGNNYTPANPNELTTGGTMNFARTKDVTITNESGASTNYAATYTAQTRLNLNTIPGLGSNIEKYKQEGKVFVKYRYFSANGGANSNTPVSHGGTNAGWIDITPYANSYVKAVSYGVDNSGTNPTLFPGPFNAPAYSSGLGNPFTANFMGTGAAFGNVGSTATVGTNQTATVVNVAGSTTAVDGEFVINWDISSGTNLNGATTTTRSFGPTTIPSVTVTGNTGTRATAVPRAFEDDFYSGAQLTSSPAGRLDAAGDAQLVLRSGGQPASYFAGTKLVQVQVFVIPGDVVKTAKAKGVDVNNLDALSRYISNK